MPNTLIIFDWNRTLYNPDIGALEEGAYDLIQNLKDQGFDLALISMNSPDRLEGIKAMIPKDCFEDIVLTKKKTPELFQSMNPQGKYERVIVVGDRIQSEIASANRVGFETVWLKTGRFKEEPPRTPDEEPDYVISSLNEFLGYITQPVDS